ncbi:hypothetical protein HDV01_006366 [Terramyces sp. JEL0728]|nr:hypothetical protein HDV01_006366 [Terramyces sp. JEL0728]
MKVIDLIKLSFRIATFIPRKIIDSVLYFTGVTIIFTGAIMYFFVMYQQRELLRKQIISINNSDLSEPEKAKRIQQLLSENHKPKQPEIVFQDCTQQSFHTSGALGCKHSKRKCKIYTKCCFKWFTCRYCHDEASDHTLQNEDVESIICMMCLTMQEIGQDCKSCKERFSRYHCTTCRIWGEYKNSKIYHCDECIMCRPGKGIGIDMFHCTVCNCCIPLSSFPGHRCMENLLDRSCPICLEHMGNSLDVKIMKCGHVLHFSCYRRLLSSTHKCPVCFKTIKDMTEQYRILDQAYDHIETTVVKNIYCHDCERKSRAKSYQGIQKCPACYSYNTLVLK